MIIALPSLLKANPSRNKMSVQLHAVKSASDAWKLLRGLVCVYKPSDYPIGTLVYHLQRNLASDLNEMRRSVEYNSFGSVLDESSTEIEDGINKLHSSDVAKYEDDYGGLATTDYATHPLVLGKGKFLGTLTIGYKSW